MDRCRLSQLAPLLTLDPDQDAAIVAEVLQGDFSQSKPGKRCANLADVGRPRCPDLHRSVGPDLGSDAIERLTAR